MVEHNNHTANHVTKDTEEIVTAVALKPAERLSDGAFTVPDLPMHYVERAEQTEARRLLLSQQRQGATLTPILITGVAGAGKTTLATALAHDPEIQDAYPHGVLWTTLGEGVDIQIAQSSWGKMLGKDLSYLPDAASRASALRDALKSKRYLLVIDGVTSVEQVRLLSVGGANSARLVISDDASEELQALRAHRINIDQMREPEALELLTRWAGMLSDVYLPTVKEIIKRLGGLPLTIALVGGQARQGITWLRLLEVLRDDQGGIANLNAQSEAVRTNALGLVVNLVLSRFGGQEVRRASLLGAFAAGANAPFSVGAAAACWGMRYDEARQTLQLLFENAIIQRLPDDLYVLHPALSQHLRKAAIDSHLVQAQKRIQSYYTNLVDRRLEAAKQIDAQISQIMVVFERIASENPNQASLFADSLIDYFEQKGLWGSLVQLADSIVDKAHAEGNVMLEHHFLNDSGYAYTMLGDLIQARVRFNRSLEVSKALGDPVGEANALNNLGAIAERNSDYATAETYYQTSKAIRERIGDKEEIAETLNNIAGVQYQQSRYFDALSTFERVLDIFETLGERQRQAQALLNFGAVHEQIGNDSDALAAYQRSLAIYANIGDDSGRSQALNNIGIVYFNIGDTQRALDHFQRSLILKEKLSDRHGQALTLNNIALLYEMRGTMTAALEQYEQAYKLLESLDDPRAKVVGENINVLRKKMNILS